LLKNIMKVQRREYMNNFIIAHSVVPILNFLLSLYILFLCHSFFFLYLWPHKWFCFMACVAENFNLRAKHRTYFVVLHAVSITVSFSLLLSQPLLILFFSFEIMIYFNHCITDRSKEEHI